MILYQLSVAVVMSGADVGLSQVLVRKMTSGVRNVIASQILVLCLWSDRELIRRHWISPGSVEVGGDVCESELTLQEKRHCRQEKGPAVERGDVRLQKLLHGPVFRAVISALV